jgi:hypothetical protein
LDLVLGWPLDQSRPKASLDEHMSFDVYLVASSASPPDATFERSVRDVLAGAGGQIGQDGVAVRMPNGETFELFGGGMFAFREFSSADCTVVFAAARQTQAYIVPTGGKSVAYKIKGAAGRPPAGFLPIADVVDAADLCSRLETHYRAWGDFANQLR